MGNVADALGDLGGTARRASVPTSKRPDVRTTKRPVKVAKRDDKQRYAKKTLYIPKDLMRDAMRKYEDAGGKEESELVEAALRLWLARSQYA